MLLCAALFAAAPAVTLGNYVREAAFAWQWNRREKPRTVGPVAAAVSGEVAL
jgi:hypothetical protein